MPRDYRASENRKLARASRARALLRPEMLYPTEPRAAAAGPTSLAVKVVDPELRRMIDEAIARRNRQ